MPAAPSWRFSRAARMRPGRPPGTAREVFHPLRLVQQAADPALFEKQELDAAAPQLDGRRDARRAGADDDDRDGHEGPAIIASRSAVRSGRAQPMGESAQAGEMQFPVQGRRAVDGHENRKTAHEGGAGRAFAAQVGRHAGDDQLLHAVPAQPRFKVGIEKGVILGFFDDRVPGANRAALRAPRGCSRVSNSRHQTAICPASRALLAWRVK